MISAWCIQRNVSTLRRIVVLSVLLVIPLLSLAQSDDPATGRDDWEKCFGRPLEWYGSPEALRIAENVLLYQRTSGGWPKNIELVKPLTMEQRRNIESMQDEIGSTIDNGATYSEIRYLMLVASQTGEERYRRAVMRGLDYLLAAQYPNGGWPQFYPLMQGYYTHITFNDDAMAGVLNLFYDIVNDRLESAWVDDAMKKRLSASMQMGIECILRCQVRRGDSLTAWCAQHDEATLAPAKARSYELPSLSGKETVGIVEFLIRIENPGRRIIDAVQAAVRWLDRSRVKGIRVDLQPDSTAPHGWNKVVVEDLNAPDLWGRFYDLETNEVFYCSRDGVKRRSMAEISNERRNHYGWLGDWPASLLSKKYPKWQRHWAPDENVMASGPKESK